MVPLKAFGLDNKLFVHKSVKFHVVDDPWVVATAAFVKLGVLAYILWAMLHPAQRQYFAFEVPSGSTAMWTLSSGFPEGIPSMPAGLCDKLPEYDILYGGGWDLLDFSCREYFYGDVVRKMDEARAIQLTTVVTEKSLAWSDCLSDAGPDHSGGCQNRTTGATAHYFVPHVDDAVIVIAHSYDAPISRKSGQNPKTKIRDHKGSIKDTLEEGENIELSLRDLLEYSGLDSLEKRNKQAQGTATGPPTYRQSGVVIEIQINYDNRRRLDGSKVLAEATVKYRDIGWSSFLDRRCTTSKGATTGRPRSTTTTACVWLSCRRARLDAGIHTCLWASSHSSSSTSRSRPSLRISSQTGSWAIEASISSTSSSTSS